jgi:hypothetical protein
VRNLSEAIYDFDLIYMMYRWTETSVNAEYGIVDDYAERQKVEHVGKILPDRWRAVFPSTLQIESISLRVSALASNFRSLPPLYGSLELPTAAAFCIAGLSPAQSPLLSSSHAKLAWVTARDS